MKRHKTVLGVLYLIWGLMGLVGMVIVGSIFALGTGILGFVAANEPDFPDPVIMLPAIVGSLILFFIGISTIPNLIAAYGLLAERSWSSLVSLVVGVLNIPSIPVGTGIGIYAIWVFLQEERNPSPAHQV